MVILGQSGAGKSTLLNILGGIDSLSTGEVIVNDSPLSKMKENELAEYRAKEIGFIFQFYNLIPTLTVYENVALMKDIKDDILNPITILERVGLKNHVKKFPNQLSGGEQQRVSIARAITKIQKYYCVMSQQVLWIAKQVVRFYSLFKMFAENFKKQ